jgi:hypothetical protein
MVRSRQYLRREHLEVFTARIVMLRKAFQFLFLLGACVVLAPSSAVGADKPARRYEVPHDGRPGVVHIDEYFVLDNPREASRLLLEEAAIAQLDVDRGYQPKPNDTMLLGSGTAAPNFSDRSLVERAAVLTSQGAPDQEIICLVKMSRYPSIRETANIMALGVRIYRGIPYYTYIVRVNAVPGTGGPFR